MTPGKLAAALVESLGAIIPVASSVALYADGDTIRIEAGGTTVLLPLAAHGVEGRLTEEEAILTVGTVLSTVHDVVSESLTDPWPLTLTGAMGLPDAAAEGDWLVGLYGKPEEGPVRVPIVRRDDVDTEPAT